MCMRIEGEQEDKKGKKILNNKYVAFQRCSFQQHNNEPIGGKVWMRNGFVLTFIRQQPRWADYFIHYRDEKNLVISAATLICFHNELLPIIIANYAQRRARESETFWWFVSKCRVRLFSFRCAARVAKQQTKQIEASRKNVEFLEELRSTFQSTDSTLQRFRNCPWHFWLAE